MAEATQEVVSTSNAAHGAVAVTTSATLVRAKKNSRVSLMVQPTNGDIFVGATSAVTTATGVKVVSGSTFTDNEYNGDIYAIAASTIDVRYWENG